MQEEPDGGGQSLPPGLMNQKPSRQTHHQQIPKTRPMGERVCLHLLRGTKYTELLEAPATMRFFLTLSGSGEKLVPSGV